MSYTACVREIHGPASSPTRLHGRSGRPEPRCLIWSCGCKSQTRSSLDEAPPLALLRPLSAWWVGLGSGASVYLVAPYVNHYLVAPCIIRPNTRSRPLLRSPGRHTSALGPPPPQPPCSCHVTLAAGTAPQRPLAPPPPQAPPPPPPPAGPHLRKAQPRHAVVGVRTKIHNTAPCKTRAANVKHTVLASPARDIARLLVIALRQ